MRVIAFSCAHWMSREIQEEIFEYESLNYNPFLRLCKKIMQDPPDVVIGICPRPSFTGEGSDSREYAWHVWMHGEHHGTQMEIILRDRKGKQRRNRDD